MCRLDPSREPVTQHRCLDCGVAGPHPYWPPHWPSPMPFPWPFGPAAPTPPHLPPSAHRHHGHPHLRFDSPPPPPWYWPAAPPPPPDPRADVAVLSAALIAIALLLVCALIARPFVKVALDAFESYLESSQELLGDSMGDSMGERSLSGWARAKRRALLALAAANHRLRRICMICMPLEGAPHRSGWAKLDEDLEAGAGRWRMGSAAPCGGRDGRFAARSARTAAPALSTGASTSTGPNVVVDSTNAAARAGLAAARSAAAPAGALRRAKPFGAQRQWPLTARSHPPHSRPQPRLRRPRRLPQLSAAPWVSRRVRSVRRQRSRCPRQPRRRHPRPMRRRPRMLGRPSKGGALKSSSSISWWSGSVLRVRPQGGGSRRREDRGLPRPLEKGCDDRAEKGIYKGIPPGVHKGIPPGVPPRRRRVTRFQKRLHGRMLRHLQERMVRISRRISRRISEISMWRVPMRSA